MACTGGGRRCHDRSWQLPGQRDGLGEAAASEGEGFTMEILGIFLDSIGILRVFEIFLG